MDRNDYITSSEKRKKGKHLTAEERGAIQALKKEGFGIHAIARKHKLFPAEEMVSTGTLYNMVWAGQLPIAVTELPEVLKRSTRERKPRENKKCYGTSISQRPEIVSQRIEEGHWESDTVVGKRDGQEAVILSLLEKKEMG